MEEKGFAQTLPEPVVTFGVDRVQFVVFVSRYEDGVKVEEYSTPQQVACNPVGQRIEQAARVAVQSVVQQAGGQ